MGKLKSVIIDGRKFDTDHPPAVISDPKSEKPKVLMTICKDGEERVEITLDDIDPDTATAAEMNALLRKKGFDNSMVVSMTPLHMLEHAEKRAESAEERCKKAQDREKAWVDWFEALRMKYTGVKDLSEKTMATMDSCLIPVHSWFDLENIHPWPSLEDERSEAIMDE